MFFSQRRVCFNDFLNRGSRFNHFQDYVNHNSSAFESWLAMTDFTVSNNVIIDFNSHDSINDDEVFKDYGMGTMKESLLEKTEALEQQNNLLKTAIKNLTKELCKINPSSEIC